MILDDLAPGARRRTHTAGTTEASLLGLLDVGIHGRRILKQGEEVNTTFCREGVQDAMETGHLRAHHRSFHSFQAAEKSVPHSCLSQRSAESLFLLLSLNPREILRFAQNDEINYFFRSLIQEKFTC